MNAKSEAQVSDLKILLIEDNPGDARLVRELLSETPGNFTVNVAERLGQGLELLLLHEVDVVLLDMNLPDSRGLDTLTGLLSQFPHLPVVVMTSMADEELAIQSVRLGAQDYLVKGKAGGELLRRALIYAIERKKLEDSLRRQASMLNMAHDAIFCWEIGGGILYWNSGARELYGFDNMEPIGKNPQSLLKTTGRDIERLDEILERGGNWEGELTHTTQDGKRIIVESRMVLIHQPGQKSLVLETNRDITGRKHMEEELRKSRDELGLRVRARTAELEVSNKALTEYAAKLERLNEELQEFAFVASHDLQEPLRKIQTFCDMAQTRCSPAMDSQGQGYLERVRNSAGRMRQLLDALLRFSRIAATPEPFKKIDLIKLAQEAADIFEERLKESGGAIEIGSMPDIEADEAQMLRLFQNLIGNALKFQSDESPRIKVHAKPNGQGCFDIFVEDNGIGFEQQFAERIFKPFQRLHNLKEYEGTGMGLAICRKIVERHGGNIKAESEPGKGSTFIIRLPVRQTGKEGVS